LKQSNDWALLSEGVVWQTLTVSGWRIIIEDSEELAETDLLTVEVPEQSLHSISKTSWPEEQQNAAVKIQSEGEFEKIYSFYKSKIEAKESYLKQFVVPQMDAEDLLLSNKINQTAQYVVKVEQNPLDKSVEGGTATEKAFGIVDIIKLFSHVLAYLGIAYVEWAIINIYMKSTERIEMFENSPELALLIPSLLVIIPAVISLVFYNNNAKRLIKINLLSNIVIIGYILFVVTWTLLLSDVMKPEPPLANLMMNPVSGGGEGIPWATLVSLFQAILNACLLTAIAASFYQVWRDNLNKGYSINPAYTKLASQQKTIRLLTKRAKAVIALLKARVAEVTKRLEQFINECEICFDLIKQDIRQSHFNERQTRAQQHFEEQENSRNQSGF